MCRVPPVRRICSLPAPLTYRNRTVPLPAAALVPSAEKSQKVGSVNRRCTPVIVPTVAPAPGWYDLALIFQGKRPAVRVKQPPRKLIALTDPMPVPASPEPDLKVPRDEDDAQKMPASPVVVSASSVVPACPVNRPPSSRI